MKRIEMEGKKERKKEEEEEEEKGVWISNPNEIESK